MHIHEPHCQRTTVETDKFDTCYVIYYWIFLTIIESNLRDYIWTYSYLKYLCISITSANQRTLDCTMFSSTDCFFLLASSKSLKYFMIKKQFFYISLGHMYRSRKLNFSGTQNRKSDRWIMQRTSLVVVIKK